MHSNVEKSRFFELENIENQNGGATSTFFEFFELLFRFKTSNSLHLNTFKKLLKIKVDVVWRIKVVCWRILYPFSRVANLCTLPRTDHYLFSC